MPEAQQDIWHREIPRTSWTRGVGLWLMFSFVVAGGFAEGVISFVGFIRGWFASSAKWMGVGPWFQFVLTVQNALVGGVAVICALYWLRNREKVMVLASGLWLAGLGSFIGPSHAPTDTSVGATFWARYALSLLMIVLCGTALNLEYRKRRQ